MTAQALMSVEEYLVTSFEDGDCEYLDGEIVEKNMGEVDHGSVQLLIGLWLGNRRREFGVWPMTETRTRVTPTRYRVPDVVVVRGGKPTSRVITEPPLLVIEILSPEDRVSRMEPKIDDYLRFGVEYIWVIDPQTGNGHIYTAERRIVVEDGKFRTENPAIEMNFAELFA